MNATMGGRSATRPQVRVLNFTGQGGGLSLIHRAKYNRNKNLNKSGTLLIAILLTSFFVAQPYFKPEHLLGMKYHWWLDMLIHGGYYFLLSLVLSFFFANHTKPIILWAIFLSVSFIFEVAQLWVPGRSFALLDFISNTLGITLGMLLYFRVLRKGNKRNLPKRGQPKS